MMLAFPKHRENFALGMCSSLSKLSGADGRFFRHSDQPGAPVWYADPDDFSRDQSIPLVIAMGEGRLKDQLGAFWKRTIKHGLCAQNGDIFWAPHHLVMWARSLFQCGIIGPWIHAVLWLGDISLIFASIFAVVYGRIRQGHSDDLNFTIMLMQSKCVASTPFARIARWIYANYRSAIKGTHQEWGPASAFEAYFSPKFTDSGAPRIDYLYNESGILKKFLL